MKQAYLIGVDLGTSATKAALYTTKGELVTQASAEVPIYYPKPGVVEQENDDFYATAAQTVQRCIRDSGVEPAGVAAIAFDSQMAGIGSIDEDYNPATRFDSWLDMRCQPYIEQMDRLAGDRVTELTGCAPTCDHGPKILWWMHERPADFARIAKFVTPAGYVAGKIAGLKADQAFMDYTFIHFTGFSDSQARRLVAGAVRAVRAGDGQAAADRRAVARGGRGDARRLRQRSASSRVRWWRPAAGTRRPCALGAGVVKPGMVFDSAGTAAVLAACTDQFVADRRHRALLCMHSVIPGLYHPLAYIAGGGIALRWFRDQFYNMRQRRAPAGG